LELALADALVMASGLLVLASVLASVLALVLALVQAFRTHHSLDTWPCHKRNNAILGGYGLNPPPKICPFYTNLVRKQNNRGLLHCSNCPNQACRHTLLGSERPYHHLCSSIPKGSHKSSTALLQAKRHEILHASWLQIFR
jgi:hypothetical protein